MAPSALNVDGGASAMDLLCSFQADLLGVTVRRPVQQETTAIGAAYLAGLATGVWASKEEAAAAWRLDRAFEPSGEDLSARYEDWKRAVERSMAWDRSSSQA
jgi:glycerol kinase